MNTIPGTFSPIPIELLNTMHFPKQEVLLDTKLIEQRKSIAQTAMKLGNSSKNKVKIMFEDTEGMKIVETTVWGMTDGYLILKRGIMLPLHCIHKIII